jgi:hypothetical protein
MALLRRWLSHNPHTKDNDVSDQESKWSHLPSAFFIRKYVVPRLLAGFNACMTVHCRQALRLCCDCASKPPAVVFHGAAGGDLPLHGP